MKSCYFINASMLKEQDAQVSFKDIKFGEKGISQEKTISGVKCEVFRYKDKKSGEIIVGMKPIQEPAKR